MTALTASPGWEGRAAVRGPADKLAFALGVFIVLTFSQSWLTALGSDGKSEPGLVRVLYFPAYLAGLAMLAMRPMQIINAVLRSPLVWVLMGVVFLSIAWSINPGLTSRRAIAILFTTLGGLVIAARYDWPELLEVLATAFAVLATLSFLAAVLVPSFGVMHLEFPGAWRGLWSDKNALGNFMAEGFIVLTAAAILNPHQRKRWAAFACLALFLVLMSTSKTSLVSLILGGGTIFWVGLVKRGPAMAVAATFLAALGVMVIAGVAAFAPHMIFDALGKDSTLTGRTEIWQALIRQVEKRPWTGYGYAVVWQDDSGWGPRAWIYKEAGFTPQHAHNAWLETWLGLGYIGLAVWIALFVQTWLQALWAAYFRPGGWFAAPWLVVYSISTLTESVAFIYHDFVWVTFVCIAVRLSMPREAPPAPVPAMTFRPLPPPPPRRINAAWP